MRRGILGWVLMTCIVALADDYQPRNTQRVGEEPPSPIEALHQMTLPEGFQATLFAHEPAVRQPIAMTLDHRGRLWVVESYSYEEWQEKGEDRILILEDSDGDGRHDSRTVFWANGKHFAGLALGHGGVWVCDAPNVLFIPDRDGDDVPDGPAEVVLDGWTLDAEHNMVNGLQWGPDGWLYGQHGVLAWSKVGIPGTPEEERHEVNCGIWRYHPQRKVFENVVRGTTNPWGMDWDEHGELFMSGNVNGHLWHVVPGAFLERMHPTDKHPYVYERLTMSADQPHYLGTQNWKQDWNRKEIGRDGADQLGGGHSHCGAMIYLGDNWPNDYRGSMFMCNTHGRRVNRDLLERRGSTFVGNYVGDFAKANQSWFRGVTMLYGPDGAVYLSDWTDDGECHDHDGVHRTSGRIFKISHGHCEPWQGDLSQVTDQVLLGYHRSKNAWFDRQSRRLLQERALTDKLHPDTVPTLKRWLVEESDPVLRLRVRWTLHGLDACDTAWHLNALDNSVSEHETAWALRLMVDYGVPSEAIPAMVRVAEATNSALVKLHLSSLAQSVPVDQRTALLAPLARRTEDAADRMIPLMCWYATEPVIAAGRADDIRALLETSFPKVQGFIVRRLAEGAVEDATLATELDDLVLGLNALDEETALARLQGLREGVGNRPDLTLPAAWEEAIAALLASQSTEVRREAAILAVRAGDQATINRLVGTVRDPRADIDLRSQALTILLGSEQPSVATLLLEVTKAGPTELRLVAIPELPKREVLGWYTWAFSEWKTLSAEERSVAVNALAARLTTARSLIERLASGAISRRDISASQAHQLAAFNDAALRESLEAHWGSLQRSSKEKRDEIERYRTLVLSSERRPQLDKGQALYERSCSVCHKLFDQGGVLGPDLTGSDRGNIDYLLNNIVDPSASVAADYRLSIVTLNDGRVITGSIVERNKSSLVMRHLTGEERVSKDAMQNQKTLKTSLMPEGLLQTLSNDEVCDLIAYLRTRASSE